RVLHLDCKPFTEGAAHLFVDLAETRLLLPAAAIELQRPRQPLPRFGSVRLALKHDVLHAELGIATYCCCELRHRTSQGIVEKTWLLRLQSGEPQADQRRDAKRCRVAPDRAACGFDLGEPGDHGFRLAHIA